MQLGLHLLFNHLEVSVHLGGSFLSCQVEEVIGLNWIQQLNIEVALVIVESWNLANCVIMNGFCDSLILSFGLIKLV